MRQSALPFPIVILLLLLPATSTFLSAQNIAINATGALPDAKAMLDISSTTSGLLIPRMTTTQRDAIAAPPVGLYVYNTTTHRFNTYDGTSWRVLGYENPSEIVVTALSDLPTPSGGAITLDPTKVYTFIGMINIGSNYINVNGAKIRGVSTSDGVMSSVSGAVLRSTDLTVSLEKFLVMPNSGSTQAYNFSDATGTHDCIMHGGCGVIDATASLGVGQISGFNNVAFMNNAWFTANGVKLTGTMARFAAFSCLANNMSGTGVEFLSGLSTSNAVISQCNFDNVGTAVKVNAGATIAAGKMLANDLRNVTTPLNGFTSYTPEWEMFMNSQIPNSRSYGYLYMNGNATATTTSPVSTYVKIAGTTSSVTLQKFTSPVSNRLTYTGKRNISARIFIAASGKSPGNAAAVSIALAKNGTVITTPHAAISGMTVNQAFQFVLDTEVSLVTNDYVEVFISNNGTAANYTISDFQFRIVE